MNFCLRRKSTRETLTALPTQSTLAAGESRATNGGQKCVTLNVLLHISSSEMRVFGCVHSL